MNCFLTALIFLSSTFMDHLLCVGSFSADVVPTSHKAAEVGEYTDTVKVEVTRVLIGGFYTLHKRLPSIILRLSMESFPDEITLELKKKALKSGGNTKICHEK